jgi:flagellar biosynthesis regulator FlbT
MPQNASECIVRDGLAFRGKHWRLWVGHDGIVRCILEGDHDRASVDAILEALGEIADKVQERPLRLLYYAHRTLRLAPQARDRLIEACRAHLNLRLAVVRASPLALIQARAIGRHSGRAFTFHASEPEALHALGAAQAVERRPKAQPPAAPALPDVGIVDHVA